MIHEKDTIPYSCRYINPILSKTSAITKKLQEVLSDIEKINDDLETVRSINSKLRDRTYEWEENCETLEYTLNNANHHNETLKDMIEKLRNEISDLTSE
jgi:septal ring factor EnvC (AmiA/AmiB activator)